MIIKIGHYSFTFKKSTALAYCCLLPLLIALGMWQLERSEEKKVFLERQEQGQTSAEVIQLSSAIDGDVDALRYKKVQAVGHYDQAHQFLIDNQISGGKAGYFVLTPFVLEGEATAVLVNRGWVPLNKIRSVLPDIPFKSQQAQIRGRINHFPAVGIKLAGAEIPTKGWPSVLQVVDSQVLAKKLGYPLFPFQIELDKDLPDGFGREWQTTTIMLPEQHTAYAVQWFALAFTLTILFIGYSFKRNDD
ncbi:SURF1 family protein [Methylobacter psychrophilus]|uniref:SURF1 family protein n=1 Tax=Methylobacter psychrophilus TaxID=96941 RepID=UPI0021D4892A|nr:SURF1 family protein [Methylobacter psychrophilus]